MNRFIFSGNIGQDVETRQTQGGKAVANFSVAVKSGWGDNESTTWLRCVIWGKRAESEKLLAKLTKGARVFGSGELSLREWQDNSGIKQKSLELNIDDIEVMLGGQPKNDPAEHASGNRNQANPTYDKQAPQPAGQDDFDDDIPF